MQPPYFVKDQGFMADLKKEKVSLSELYPAMKAVLESGGEFLFYPDGKSMLPTIKHGRDGVCVVKAEKLSRGDILLYRRRDGSFVLHRLVKKEKNGSLTMRGDSQFIDERGVSLDAVIGKACAIERNGKKKSTASLSFRTRSALRLFFYPLKRFLHRACGKIKRTVRGQR